MRQRRNINDQKIYASMARMSGNDKCPSGKFGDSLQLINCIVESVAKCNMTSEFSYFIPGPYEETDKHIEIVDGHHVTAEKKGQVQIKINNNNGDTFITTLHNVLLAPDLCDRLFSIITLMNLGHTCLFQKGVFTVYSEQNRKMRLHYHVVHKGNMHFWGEIKEISTTKKLPSR